MIGTRTLAAPLALLCLSTAAGAQDRGTVAVDLMTTPGRHVGFGYSLTHRLSLRPSVGVAYSPNYGTSFNVGTDLRWELLPASRVSPYVTASFNYLRDPGIVQYDTRGVFRPDASPNLARYGAGLGLHAHVSRRVSLVAEGRLMNSELRELSDGYYNQQHIKAGAHFEGALGLSYTFN